MGVGPYPTLEQATGRNINASKVHSFLFRKLLLLTREDHTSLHLSLLPLLGEVTLT